MNLLLLHPGERLPGSGSGPAVGDRFAVSGARAAHLRQQLEAAPGRVIHVGLLDGPIGQAEVLEVKSAEITLRVRALSPAPRPGRGRLLLAMPRAKVLRRLLPQLAALGVEEIVIFRSWRVDRGDLEHPVLTPEVATPLLHEGLMQACLTRAPRLRVERRFRPWVEDRLPFERPGELRVLAHPRARTAEGPIAGPLDGPWALAVGPERGLLDEEVAALGRAGFRPRRLGPGILRVETACVAGLGQLLALEG